MLELFSLVLGWLVNFELPCRRMLTFLRATLMAWRSVTRRQPRQLLSKLGRLKQWSRLPQIISHLLIWHRYNSICVLHCTFHPPLLELIQVIWFFFFFITISYILFCQQQLSSLNWVLCPIVRDLLVFQPPPYLCDPVQQSYDKKVFLWFVLYWIISTQTQSTIYLAGFSEIIATASPSGTLSTFTSECSVFKREQQLPARVFCPARDINVQSDDISTVSV